MPNALADIAALDRCGRKLFEHLPRSLAISSTADRGVPDHPGEQRAHVRDSGEPQPGSAVAAADAYAAPEGGSAANMSSSVVSSPTATNRPPRTRSRMGPTTLPLLTPCGRSSMT